MVKKKHPRFDTDNIADDDLQMFMDFLETDSFPDKEIEPSTKLQKSRSKKTLKPIIVDLHGKTLTEAQSFMDSFIQDLKDKRGSVTLKVITGKGLNSGSNGGVLASEIHRYVSERFGLNIIKIDESPDKLRINNVPIRGHFCVTFKF